MGRTRSDIQRRGTCFVVPMAAVALLTLGACSGAPESAGEKARATPAERSAAASVQAADSPLGRVLTDNAGRTLYAFTRDKPGNTSACDADCIAVWPALTSAKDVTAGSGVNASLLDEVRLTEGVEQATYGDWPLYYYVGDVASGDVNGQGLDGEWFVIGADGKLIKKGL